MEIKIIGKGCYFCRTMHKICGELVAEMKLQNTRVLQVDDMEEMLDYGVVNPPALIINGNLKMMGRVLVSLYLQKEGLTPIPTASGEEALNLINKHTPDVIILDLMLPGVDGLEVCRNLRRVSDTPIIIL